MATPIVPEEWRVVAEFPDYEVSSHGRVRRCRDYVIYNKRKKTSRVKVPAGMLLRPGLTRGYPVVCLANGGKKTRKMRHVAILVCRAFHGEPPSPAHQAAHGDGCPTNNVYTNLRWALPVENAADKIKHGTHPRGTTNPGNKLSEEQVRSIRREYAAGGTPQYYIAAKYGLH